MSGVRHAEGVRGIAPGVTALNHPTVEGVAYTPVTGTDLLMFRCEEQEATLSTRGCAARHLAAAKASTTADGCARCPIGAQHAGRPVIEYAPVFGSDRCPRCAFATERMIGNRICVGCYNREREMRAGRNARGNRPAQLPGLVEVPLRVSVDGRELAPLRRLVAADHQAKVKTGRRDKRDRPIYVDQERGGSLEAALQTLRTTRGVVDFRPIVSAPPQACQPELFAA